MSTPGSDRDRIQSSTAACRVNKHRTGLSYSAGQPNIRRNFSFFGGDFPAIGLRQQQLPLDKNVAVLGEEFLDANARVILQ